MGGKKGDEEEMGHPLHILAQIISEQLKSVLISRRCPEAARLKAALEKGGLIQERQRRLEVNLERVLQGGERWGRASRLKEGHCSRPTAPTPLLAPTPHVGPPFLSCNAPPSFQSVPTILPSQGARLDHIPYMCTSGCTPTHSHLSP